MTCTNCGHSQDEGKFCGKCGTKLESTPLMENVAVNEQAATTVSHEQPIQQTVTAEPNIHVEKIKDQSKMYGSYFTRQLKRPALSFNQLPTEFTNGIISIVLLVMLISISFVTFIKSFVGEYGPGFLSIFTNTFIFSIIAIGIVTLSLFMISRFFGPQLTFKSICSVYGGHLSPLLIASVVSILLMFLKSYTYGNILLSIVFLFAVFILPLYLISSLVTKQSSSIDPLYGFMLYIAAFSILFFIFVTILADSSLGEYINRMMYMF